LRYGKHILTFESGKEKGTFVYAAEKMPDFDNEYFRLYWHQYNEEAGLNNIFYPETKNCVLYLRHDGAYVSKVKAKSSNNKIATVKTSKGKVYVTNKSQGECTITVKSGKNIGEITWVVRGGKALKQPAVSGIPISKNVDRAKAKKAVDTILSSDYSSEEMKALAKKNLTLEQWQKKLSKPADVINMLHALNFKEANGDGMIDNDNVQYGGLNWCRKLSPEGNFKQRGLVCLSTCEMMNYLLRNDMDEQGYVEYADPGGGHTICYFKVNGLYVFCDFVDSVVTGKDWPKAFYGVYVCEDPKDFADFYVSGPEQNNPKAPGYIDILYMFPMEGRAIPAADDDSAYHLPDTGVCSIFPEKWNGKNTKDIITVLYRAEGFQEKYAPGPPESEFPEK
ncbi:MAG: Ig-like domain-containing protein, partial [Lachnospiraceae bacterium]|nr:Ig-like domain-containing protein [Lachnospiraceae bacterium]